MIHPPHEAISGRRLLELLEDLADSRRTVKMQIPQTEFGWITVITGIQKTGGSLFLVIDPVRGFEKALAAAPDRQIFVEFIDFDRVPGYFMTRVALSGTREIRAEVPRAVYRIQRRAFYRVAASSGTEIFFHVLFDQAVRARVRDFSLGGLAFYRPSGEEGFEQIKVAVQFAGNQLIVPDGDHTVTVPISLSVIRRVMQDVRGGSVQGAMEFLQLSETSRSMLERYIFQQQRARIQNYKRIRDTRKDRRSIPGLLRRIYPGD